VPFWEKILSKIRTSPAPLTDSVSGGKKMSGSLGQMTSMNPTD
jgi:hypothetical protein